MSFTPLRFPPPRPQHPSAMMTEAGRPSMGLPSAGKRAPRTESVLYEQMLQGETDFTALEWVILLEQKDRREREDPGSGRSEAAALETLVEKSPTLKRLLMQRAAALWGGWEKPAGVILAPTLVEVCQRLSRGATGLEGKILAALQQEPCTDALLDLCGEHQCTLDQLMIKAELPTELPRVQAAWEEFLPRFVMRDADAQSKLDRLAVACVDEKEELDQVDAVEFILEKVPSGRAEGLPQLLRWLDARRKAMGSTWLKDAAEQKLKEWLGALRVLQVQQFADIMAPEDLREQLGFDEPELKRLRQRAWFWRNYSARFRGVRLLLPLSTWDVIGEHLEEFDVGFIQSDASGAPELLVLEFGEFYAVEVLRGTGEIHLFLKHDVLEQLLYRDKRMSLERLRCMASVSFDREHGWERECWAWLQRYGLDLSPGLGRFRMHEGQMRIEGEALPELPSDDQRRRDRVMERWTEGYTNAQKRAESNQKTWKLSYGERYGEEWTPQPR